MDAPATPYEKLRCLELQARALGKAFNENDAIDYVNSWWLARGGDRSFLLKHVPDPLILEESEERARQIRLDDRSAREELERAQKEAQESIRTIADKRIADEMLQVRLAKLEEKLMQVLAENERLKALSTSEEAEEAKAAIIERSAAEAKETPRHGRPDMSWSLAQLKTYARGIGITENLEGWTKAQILQEIVVREDEMEALPA